MIFSLALRNLWLNLRKRLFVVSIIALSVAALLIGNTILAGTDVGIERTYKANFTGDYSVSARAGEPFTIFGNELPLVGDYEVVPAMADSEKVDRVLEKRSEIADTTRLVSSAAVLQVGGVERGCLSFGVDFVDYFAFFPQLKMFDGQVPESGSPGLLLNEAQRSFLESRLGRPLAVGEPLLLTANNNSGFTIREIPYRGCFRYPVTDEILSRIILVDVNTARSLIGYVYGADRSIKLDADKTALIGRAIDDMFGDAQSDTVASTSGIDSRSLEKELADKEAALRAVQTVDGAWNFCLVRTRPGAGGAVFQRSLAAELDNAGLGVQLRDWRQTAGGNASIIFFLSLFFNTGMVFITGIAIFIVTNSLALSIHERTREIGTMRALGAQKSFVVKLLAAETLALVGGAGLVGVGLGMAGLRAVALMGIPLANPLLVSLFGTTVLRPELSLQQVVFHLGFSVAVGCAALVWPVWIAIRIQPIRALSKD